MSFEFDVQKRKASQFKENLSLANLKNLFVLAVVVEVKVAKYCAAVITEPD